jgi:hypothetical protein
MKFYRSLPAIAFGLVLSLGTVGPICAAGQDNPAYPAPYTDLRGLVDRTQNDLRAASDLEHGNDKQRERYRNAQGHLSTFDRDMSKGKFGKGELDKSIDSIKSILDHNVLQASSRDALMHDLDDLRIARDHRY